MYLGKRKVSWEDFFEKGFVLNFLKKKREGMSGMGGLESMTTSWEKKNKKGFVLNFSEKKSFKWVEWEV